MIKQEFRKTQFFGVVVVIIGFALMVISTTLNAFTWMLPCLGFGTLFAGFGAGVYTVATAAVKDFKKEAKTE